MNVNLSKLEQMDRLIAAGVTGNPGMLAEKLKISETTLHRYIGVMKNIGAPIEYNRGKQSYLYKQKGRFNIGFCFTGARCKLLA